MVPLTSPHHPQSRTQNLAFYTEVAQLSQNRPSVGPVVRSYYVPDRDSNSAPFVRNPRASLPTTAGYLPRADAARPRRLCTTTSRPERRELPPKTAQRTRDDPDWRSPARPSWPLNPPPLTPRGGTTRCYYRFPFMSERSLHDLRTTWRRPVGGGARLRAHGGNAVLPCRGQMRAMETATANSSKGGQHANTEAVPLSAAPCRSYQPLGTTASQLFQNWPQRGAASARKRLTTTSGCGGRHMGFAGGTNGRRAYGSCGQKSWRGCGFCPTCDH